MRDKKSRGIPGWSNSKSKAWRWKESAIFRKGAKQAWRTVV